MKKGETSISVILFVIVVLFIIEMLPTVNARWDVWDRYKFGNECNNGLDDDGDGKIDAQKILLPNTDTITLGTKNLREIYEYNDNPIFLASSVAEKIIRKKFPYIPTYSHLGKNGVAIILGSSINNPDVNTLTKVCNIMGFRTYIDYACESSDYRDNDGSKRCNFVDNGYLWKFNSLTNNFETINAEGNVWLSKITCVDRLPACSDGWDNDNDGKCDRSGCTIKENGVIKALPPDDGCKDPITDTYNPIFDSEAPDSDCYNAEDTNEYPASVCSDGWDNDNDGLIDINDDGCVNIDDNDEIPEKQCNDEVDNDYDGKCDYNGCNGLPLDSGCIDENDESENTPECSNEKDDDSDGKTDFKTDGTGDPGCTDLIDDIEDDIPITSITKAFWGNAFSDKISEADRKDAVTLNLVGNNLIGKDITYEIYKDNGDGVLDPSEKVNTFRMVYGGNPVVPAIWISGKHINGNSLGGDYYFKAKIDDKEITSESSLLVKDEIKNDPPIIRIINPEDKQIYFIDEEIPIKIYYEDEDDYLIDFEIYVHAGSPGYKNIFRRLVVSKGIIETKTKFSPSDTTAVLNQQKILVKAGHNLGHGTLYSTRGIFIMTISPQSEKRHVFANINNPIERMLYPFGNVRFSSIGSYAVDVKNVDGGITINCFSGLCPKQTKGCLPVSGDQPGCRIPVFNAPSKSEEANYDNMAFRWNFNLILENKHFDCDNIIGNDDILGSNEFCGIEFNKILFNGYYGGFLTASLKDEELTWTGDLSNAIRGDSNNINFAVIPSEDLTCVIPEFDNQYPDTFKDKSYWISKDSIDDSSDNCFKEDGSPKTCCPNGFKCNQEVGSPNYNKCVNSITDTGTLINNCNDYKDEQKCKDDEYSVAKPSGLECGETEIGICMKKEWCRCEWDTDTCNSRVSDVYYIDENNNGKFDRDLGEEVSGTNAEINDICNPRDDEILDPNEIGPGCVFTPLPPEGDCSLNGTKIQRFTSNNPSCHKEPIKYYCSNLAKLGFFSWWNILLAIIVLFIIYFFYLLSKRIRNKRINKNKIKNKNNIRKVAIRRKKR